MSIKHRVRMILFMVLSLFVCLIPTSQATRIDTPTAIIEPEKKEICRSYSCSSSPSVSTSSYSLWYKIKTFIKRIFGIV